jgi:hypothetical protein
MDRQDGPLKKVLLVCPMDIYRHGAAMPASQNAASASASPHYSVLLPGSRQAINCTAPMPTGEECMLVQQQAVGG